MIIANFFGTRREPNDMALYIALLAQWAIVGFVVGKLVARKQRKTVDADGT